MSRQQRRFAIALVRALEWKARTGWPTKASDLTTARMLLAESTDPAGLLRFLLAAFGHTQPDAMHRAVLCRVVIEAFSRASGPATGDR